MRSISIKPELQLLIVVSGVLKAWARPSSIAERSCSLCRAASAVLSAEKERARSIATADKEAVALMEDASSECPQMTSAPIARVPERSTRREEKVGALSSLR